MGHSCFSKPTFDFVQHGGWHGTASLVRVLDGDTVSLELDIPSLFSCRVIHSCRLEGIDAPETGGRAHSDLERALEH